MKLRNAERENGQILILVVLVLVGIMAFAALAIDGGMTYFDRRNIQRAADAASLAGALSAGQYFHAAGISYQSNFPCSNGLVSNATMLNDIYSDAISRAARDDYTIDSDVLDNNGSDVWVTCSSGLIKSTYIDVHVKITAETKTSLLHFAYTGPVINTVEAVARVRPEYPFGYGNTIVSLNLANCSNSGNAGGIFMDGSSTITVAGGGMFSNSCFNDNGGNNLSVNVSPGSINYNSGFSYSQNNNDTISPAPASTDQTIPYPKAFPVNCDPTVQNKKTVSGSDTIDPGSYRGIDVKGNSDHLTMNPGLYCLYDDFVASSGTISGNGVTIYVISDHNFKINSGTPGVDPDDASIQLTAPPVDFECADPNSHCPLPGILIYMQNGNTGNVSINGNNTSQFSGIILGADASIDIGGTASSSPTYNVQVIGNSVKVHGNVNITFDTTHNTLLMMAATEDQYR